MHCAEKLENMAAECKHMDAYADADVDVDEDVEMNTVAAYR